VYEIRVDRDGSTHNCTIISKGDELLITIEVRNPVNEKAIGEGKEGNIVVDGHIDRFKINKTDGIVVPLSWTVYGETDKGVRMGNSAKKGPSAKEMLEPFREVLRKLPSDIYPLLERVLKSAQ
jgi:D-Tyr-tRNAtyr deacylase